MRLLQCNYGLLNMTYILAKKVPRGHFEKGEPLLHHAQMGSGLTSRRPAFQPHHPRARGLPVSKAFVILPHAQTLQPWEGELAQGVHSAQGKAHKADDSHPTSWV